MKKIAVIAGACAALMGLAVLAFFVTNSSDTPDTPYPAEIASETASVDPAPPEEEPDIVFAGLVGDGPAFITDIDFGEGEFPVVRIYTEEPAIDRNNWISATISLSNTDEEFEFEDVETRIRGRGQSSWRWPKRPFRIRFEDARPMLDSGHAARDWTFIANHYDNSLLRNYSAYYLASLLDGMYVAPFARFVDVYFNGEYQGVYMLSIQHSYITEGQVNLSYDPDPAVSEYLIELDYRIRNEGVEFQDFVLVNTRSFEIRYPSGRSMTREHAIYVREFLYRIESLLLLRDEAVFDYIHLPSFVDFYLLSELYKDVDIGFSSFFMQIRGQGADRRLELGPVWDHDRSLGNDWRNVNLNTFGYHPREPYGIWAGRHSHIFFFLLEMPTFYNAVVERWNEIKDGQIPQTIARIEYMASTYEASFERNFLRWPILGIRSEVQPYEVGEIDTFAGHVAFIVDYLERRTAWLDEYFNSTCCRDPLCESRWPS